MKKYQMVKMPLEAYLKDKERTINISKKLKELTGKDKNIKMTQFQMFRASKPVYIYDDEIISFFTNKKRKDKIKGSFL